MDVKNNSHFNFIITTKKEGYIMSDKIGVIHEIGDMGLGFTELTPAEQKQLEQDKKAKEKTEKHVGLNK
jgi:hypothetical protein